MNTAPLANTRKSKHLAKIFLPEKFNIDRGCKTETPLDQRFHARLKEKDLCTLFDMPEIPVQIFTDDIAFTGHMYDIGKDGMAVNLSTLFVVDSIIGITFFLGKKEVASRAVVKRIDKAGKQFVAGIMFVDLAKEYAEYIDVSVCIGTLLSNLKIDA